MNEGMVRLARILDLREGQSFTENEKTWLRIGSQIIVYRNNEVICTKSLQNLYNLYERVKCLP